MLARIFGSNARVKILKTFLGKPEQKYYTRQLSRDLALQVNSVRRELENLQNIGLIKEEGIEHESVSEEEIEEVNTSKNSKKTPLKNDKKYFVVDRDFLLFRELKSLFAKANLLSCQDFLKNIDDTGKIKHLWLSGIFTGETQAPVDLLLVGKVNKTQFLQKIKVLEEDLGKEINFTIMDESEYEYRTDINDIFLYKLKQCHTLHEIDRETAE
ncbi:hypothetical protein JXE04_03375 [Patescibacteria group bacterium]|nr:hypothetical protein [Patescibacteria group bacterium]